MPSEKLKYIHQRLKDYEFVPRTDIELTPLKEEIERVFVKGNIDEDCDKIARLLRPYEEKVQTIMDGDNFKDAFSLFYEILQSLSYHFVNDEHYCHFDDMYSTDFICDTMMTMIINRIENGRVPEDELKTISDAMSKIEKMEALLCRSGTVSYHQSNANYDNDTYTSFKSIVSF